jgi:hypothetical protein
MSNKPGGKKTKTKESSHEWRTSSARCEENPKKVTPNINAPPESGKMPVSVLLDVALTALSHTLAVCGVT